MQINKEIIDQMKLMRKKGHSLSEISNEFHIAKSTASRYVGNIEPLPQYQSLLVSKRGGSKKKKLIKEEKALHEAKLTVDKLSFKEKLLFLSALYWGEGSKKDFGLSNTDPALIQVFVNGLRELFSVSDDRLRISLRIYEDLDKQRCLQFWSKVVKIPQEKFIGITVLSGKKKGKLAYGMCRVRVTKSEALLKKFKALNTIIHKHFVPIA